MAVLTPPVADGDEVLPLPQPLAIPQAVGRAQRLGRLIEALDRALCMLRDEEAEDFT
ncbi:hypothetical protein ACFCXR_37120 [Streptomyces noursei]|uniref:hypothetical protein n=1 Tax=Streptomyces noursei TaxID=1971 RepID=UPI0035E3BB90